MRMGKLNVLTSVVLSSLLLSACGGGDSGSDSPAEGPVVEQAPVSARDGFNVVAPDEAGYVDLSSLIESGTAGAKVTDVYLESSQGSGQCGQVQTGDEGSDILGQGFNVTVEGAAICEYGYEVESVALAGQTKTRARAKVMVASSAGGAAVLPPISIAMAVGDPELETDIKAALGTDFPAGYTLSEDFSVLGDGEVDISTDDFTITYQATAEGVSRVVYALEGNIAGVPDIKMGTLDYAVSDSLNNAPTAANFAYDEDVEINTSVDIDVSGYIEDVIDSDELQLIEVKSYTANVASKNAADLTNTVFTFEAPTDGEHYVSYMVSDHRGGFATGIVEVTAFDANQVARWTDIDYWDDPAKRLLTFSAPKTKFEIEQTTSEYQGSYTDNGYTPALQLATFTYAGAQAYCGGRGRLPTSAEMDVMYDAVDPKVNKLWPAGKAYITQDGSNAGLYSIENGTPNVMGTDTYNVTCVDSGGLTVDVVRGVAVANGTDRVQLDFALVRDTGPVANAILSVETTNDAVPDSSTYTTDENGLATIKVTSIKSGDSKVTVTYVGDNGISVYVWRTVNFIGDIDTARVAQLSVLQDNASSDGVEENSLRAELLDANGNPVVGALVEVSLDSGTAMIQPPPNLYTDDSGFFEIKVTNDVEEVVSVTSTFTSLLNGLSSQQADITFNSNAIILSGNFYDGYWTSSCGFATRKTIQGPGPLNVTQVTLSNSQEILAGSCSSRRKNMLQFQSGSDFTYTFGGPLKQYAYPGQIYCTSRGTGTIRMESKIDSTASDLTVICN
ncbi:hypothetical protein FM037_08170 [Shewanella psychropiezotolerans]|uniref:Big-1 domain-containing protein n=1 Tax=Shewanella psychropiezotolerans TaxID=2593655 RepID=A0ABX5WW94_9GAMM|nr:MULTISPECIES: Ig-like domain-containing protein [Shewanella]MPY22478.1 hypothetical protein [Shewanella sp. YLB-07]QDO83208.1 hypothetical protein FM037_08170 [Shewanella psychropiezotolerans]